MKDILEAIKGVRFGEVVIKIQDSRIVQIERVEKFRINKANPEKEGEIEELP